MSFDHYIQQSTNKFKIAWNEIDLLSLEDFLEENVTLTVPKVSFSNLTIPSQQLTGKSSVLDFFKKVRTRLNLRYNIEKIDKGDSKSFKIKLHYYEIDAWAWYDCTFSKYGRYSNFELLYFEDVESKKITLWSVLKNIAKHKLKTLGAQLKGRVSQSPTELDISLEPTNGLAGA